MPRYKSTTWRRYLWGIGTVCSFLPLMATCSWAIEGKVGFRLKSFGRESVVEIRREIATVRFWAIAGFCVAASVAAVIVAAVGLSRVRSDEDNPA